MLIPQAAFAARWLRRFAGWATAAGLAVAVGGCAGGVGNFFGSSERPATQQKTAAIILAPVIGAPAKLSKDLTARLAIAAKERGIPVVEGKGKADFTVRGYLVGAIDPQGSKISYIWDITDASGNRAQRISGEELIPGKSGGDPWSAVDTGALDRISQKTASELVAKLPRRGGEVETATAGATPADRAATTGSTGNSETSFLIPAVSGAPGDGKKSLTEAIRKRLSSSGVKLVSTLGRNVYTVKGSVSISPADDGKQSVRIDWQVIDPAGKRLGTVSQQNTIQRGSLDGAWGPIADAAANAAADGILKLIPKKSG